MSRALIRSLRQGCRPVLILICGAPGSGKSTTAVKLAGRLDFAVVQGTDEIRDIMQIYDFKPELAGKSHDRWQLFGRLSKSTFKLGYMVHARAIKTGVMRIIGKNCRLGENLILEGTHLAPSLYQKLPDLQVFHFLLTVSSFEQHQQAWRDKARRRHGQNPVWPDTKIRHTAQIQTILEQEAQHHPIFTIPSRSPYANCQAIMQILKQFYWEDQYELPPATRQTSSV